MRSPLRSIAAVLVLLAAGASTGQAATLTQRTITPQPRTVSGIQNQVIPLSDKGTEDAEFGVARFSFEFDQEVDVELRVNNTVAAASTFAGGTTDNVASPVEFTINGQSTALNKNQANTVVLSVRDAATGGTTFPAASSDTSFAIYVDTQAPNAPGDFSADGADEVLIVRWDAPTKSTAIEVFKQYIITYSTSDFSGMTTEQVAALPNKRVEAVGKQETTIDDVQNGSTYFITVRAVDWVNNVSDFPKETTGGAIKVVQATPVRTVTLAELAGEEGGCFIATAAYGSYQEPHVMVLRQFRDQVLLKSEAGEKFVGWYYRTSPKFAAWIAAHDTARALARVALLPLYIFAYLVLHPAWLIAAGLMLLTLATAGAKLRRQVQ
jgi:hypothetical protein